MSRIYRIRKIVSIQHHQPEPRFIITIKNANGGDVRIGIDEGDNFENLLTRRKKLKRKFKNRLIQPKLPTVICYKRYVYKILLSPVVIIFRTYFFMNEFLQIYNFCFMNVSIFYCFGRLLLNHLRTERFLLLRRPRPLILEEANGERLFGIRARSCAEEAVAGLNHLARCLVPRSVLLEQGAELSHRAFHHLAGVDPPIARMDGTDLFLVEYGIAQIDTLVVVEKEDVADMAGAKSAESVPAGSPDAATHTAGVECVIDSLVRLGLLGGLDRAGLQLGQSDWDAFGGHKGLCARRGVCVHRVPPCERGFVGLKGLEELCGGSGLDGLHLVVLV